jgi:hypothetical protein
MDSRWYKGFKEKEAKDKRTREILAYRNAFDALKEVLEGQFEESTPDYKNPSWSHEQADVNGANRKLRQIINLITIKDT